MKEESVENYFRHGGLKRRKDLILVTYKHTTMNNPLNENVFKKLNGNWNKTP